MKPRIYALNSHKTSLDPKCIGAGRMQLTEKRTKLNQEALSTSLLVEFPSQGTRSLHQLLELVLLHLGLASSHGADGMHGVVVAQTLHVCHTRGGGRLDGDLVAHIRWVLHLSTANKWSRVRLVGLAAIGVASLADSQDGRVGLVLVVDLSVGGLGSGCVHRDGRGRGLEWAKTTGEFLHRHLCIGAIQHAEFAVLFAEGSELLFGL